MFEIMRYDRGMDVMPYAIGVRLRPPLTDPPGSEPTFVLLDSDVEVEEFMAAFNGPVAFDRPGAISWEPLLCTREPVYGTELRARTASVMIAQIAHSGLDTEGT